MKPVTTLLRRAEEQALRGITLSGSVIDLGGDTHAQYRNSLQGSFTVTTVNMDEKTSPTIFHNLETPLPIPACTYDHALIINVLEHIYHARQLLGESVRILKPAGSVTVIVPFLFPLHKDPSDYWRFSEETLQKMFEELELSDIRITPLGTGVFSARYVMLDRLLPYPLRYINFYTIRYVTSIADAVFTKLARQLGKKYEPSDYALGYMVQGTNSKKA